MITPTQFYKKTSEQENVNLELVTLVNNFYWRKVASLVRSCEHDAIYIKNIGTFYGSKIKVNKEIKNVIRRLREVRTKEKTERNLKDEARFLKNLQALLRMRDKLASQLINKTAQKWRWFQNG